MEVNRQVRYYLDIKTSEQDPSPHHWYFYIQGTRGETHLTQSWILKKLAMCSNIRTLESGIIIPNESIIAKLICFDSQRGKIENPGNIYDSRDFAEDRNLKTKRFMDEAQFAKYYSKFL